MGCFHVAKSRKHLEQEKLRSVKSYNSLYDNQPALLPDPQTVEILSHSRLLSAPSQSSVSELDLQLTCQGPSDHFPPCTVANLSAASGGFSGNSNKSSPETAVLVGRPVPLPMPQARHPLPLPLQRSSSASNPRFESQFKSSKTFQSLSFGSEPQPLPLPSQVMSIRLFGREEILAGSEEFSPLHWLRNTRVGSVYRCFVKTPGSNDKMEVDVTRMTRSNTKAENECLSYFETLAQVQSPFVSKLLGLCMPKEIGQSIKNLEWLVVSEHCESESLETLLKKQDQSALDWSARMKITLGIARGLEYLHEKFPLQGCFDGDFDLCNILVDKNCNPKLSDYGFQHFLKQDVSEAMDISTDRGRSVPGKVAVRNFGKVLLALIVARQYLDKIILRNDEILQNIRPLLTDAAKLRSILDPALKGQQMSGSMKKVANLAFHCLQDVAELRPQLQEILEVLYSTQDVKNTKPLKSFKSSMLTIAASGHNLPLPRVSSTKPTAPKMFELPQLVAADKPEEDQKTREQSAGVSTQTPLQPLSTNAAATAIKTSRSMSAKLDYQPLPKHMQTPNLRCSSSFGRHELGRNAFQAKLYQTS